MIDECELSLEIGEAFPISMEIPNFVQVINTGTVMVLRETAVGPISGSNRIFNTAHPYVPGNLLVTLNGLTQNPGASNDYVESTSTSFMFNQAPIPGDVVAASYERA